MCRLDDNNSVYQAELRAMHSAIIWIYQLYPSKFIHIYIDCLSSLQAIHAFKSSNLQILTIKSFLLGLIHKTSIAQVLAHKGIIGSEAADALDKASTSRLTI